MTLRLAFAIPFLLYTICINNCACQSSNVNDNINTNINILPEPRAYIPEADKLDFVYHNHDEMTRFLRYLYIIIFYLLTIRLSI